MEIIRLLHLVLWPFHTTLGNFFPHREMPLQVSPCQKLCLLQLVVWRCSRFVAAAVRPWVLPRPSRWAAWIARVPAHRAACRPRTASRPTTLSRLWIVWWGPRPGPAETPAMNQRRDSKQLQSILEKNLGRRSKREGPKATIYVHEQMLWNFCKISARQLHQRRNSQFSSDQTK